MTVRVSSVHDMSSNKFTGIVITPVESIAARCSESPFEVPLICLFVLEDGF